MDQLYLYLFILISYLTGSFPSAVLIGKFFYKKDVREFGSGNAGATNTFRVLGTKAGIPVLIIDVFKGWLSVNYIYLTDLGFNNIDLFFQYQLVFGIAAVLGHLFPIYTGFRGGKGMATMLGLLIAIELYAALFSIAIFAIILIISRYVSLGSIVASLALFILSFLNIKQSIKLKN